MCKWVEKIPLGQGEMKDGVTWSLQKTNRIPYKHPSKGAKLALLLVLLFSPLQHRDISPEQTGGGNEGEKSPPELILANI